MIDGPTTVQIRKSTRLRLKRFGSKEEIYDDIINRLLDSYLDQDVSKSTTLV